MKRFGATAMRLKSLYFLFFALGFGLLLGSCTPGVYVGASAGYPYGGGYGYGPRYYAPPVRVRPAPYYGPGPRFHGGGGFRGGEGGYHGAPGGGFRGGRRGGR